MQKSKDISIKKGPYKMFVMSSALADTKNNENTCAGELKTIRKRIFNYFNSDKGGLLSENESEDDIWSQTGQLHVIMTIRRPPPEKGQKSIRPNATKRPYAPHQPLVNNNGNGAERGFEWEHYSFEDPHNHESNQIFRNDII